MITIHKFELYPATVQSMMMPIGAEILSVQVQHEHPYLWAKVDTDVDRATRRFAVIGTGHEIPEGVIEYIGTIQLEGGSLVFHVFEVTP